MEVSYHVIDNFVMQDTSNFNGRLDVEKSFGLDQKCRNSWWGNLGAIAHITKLVKIFRLQMVFGYHILIFGNPIPIPNNILEDLSMNFVLVLFLGVKEVIVIGTGVLNQLEFSQFVIFLYIQIIYSTNNELFYLFLH